MSRIAFDTETKGLDWFKPEEQAFLGTWADESGEWHAVLSDAPEPYAEALTAADQLIGHNLKFDIHQTRETLGLDVLNTGAELHDTDLLGRVVHPELRSNGGSYRLKDLGKVFVKPDAADEKTAIKEMAKAIGLRTIKQAGAYFDVWRAYPEVMEAYAREDARLTYDLFEKFYPKLRDEPALKLVYELEMAVLPILTRAEQRGIKTDQAACDRLKATYEPQLAEVRASLIDELGEEALGGEGSTEALTDALLSIGVPLHRKTKTGQLATNKFALAEFAKDFPVIDALEEYRTLTRFMTTYIEAVDGNDVVHTSIQQFEAWTGRMSSRRPNMQNLPKRAGKEVRSVFVPREGHSFVVADYDSIEARLLAYYLGDRDYQRLLEDGHDPHAWMAANVWGGEPGQYAKGTPGEEQRNMAKNVTYAICYGAGAPRVMDMTGLDRAAAKALISKVKASLPGFWKLDKRIRNKIETVGYVNTLFGRKNVVNRDKAYVGLNALIQGSAADICKQGLVNVDHAVKPLGGVPLLVVHDEIVVEVPSECAEECLTLIEAAMCDMSSIPDIRLFPTLKVTGSITGESYAAV